MNQTYKEVNKYLSLNSVKEVVNLSLSDKKRKIYCECCVEPLVEEAYLWDPEVRRFKKSKA